MRLQIVSDLHLEAYSDSGSSFLSAMDPSVADVLILSGDIGKATDLRGFYTLFRKYENKPVLWVLGNHEYYGQPMAKTVQVLRTFERRYPNVQILLDRAVTIDKQRFIGSTLWYSSPREDPDYRDWADFLAIDDLDQHIDRLAQEGSSFLETSMREGDVVISHMLPSEACIASRWIGNPSNRYFVHDVSSLIRHRKPKLWVHGHTHDQISVHIGDTHIVANPRGYPDEIRRRGQPYDMNFVVEI